MSKLVHRLDEPLLLEEVLEREDAAHHSRFRICSALWGGGTAVLLVGACLWQVVGRGYSAADFAPMMLFCCIYLMTNARIVFSGVSMKSIVKAKRSMEAVPASSPEIGLAEAS